MTQPLRIMSTRTEQKSGVWRQKSDNRRNCLGKEFETAAMLWTDQLEIATIEREQAREQRSEIRRQRSANHSS
jgi:hypothetical protein